MIDAPAYVPPPPPPAEAPAQPLTRQRWSAGGALLFGVLAFAVNAGFTWLASTGPAGDLFLTVGESLEPLPAPLGLIAQFALFAAFYVVMYGLLLAVPVGRALVKRQTLAQAFGLRRFAVPLTVGLVLSFYVVGIMANGAWGLGLKAAKVRMPSQEIEQLVREFAGTDVKAPPAPGGKAVAPKPSLGKTLPRFLVLFVLIAVVAPVAEEVVYRGVVYASLREAWGELPGLAVSSLLFGLVHVDFRFAVPAVVLGVLLATIFRVTRSLWPAILLHSTYNGLSLLLVYSLALAGRSLS